MVSGVRFQVSGGKSINGCGYAARIGIRLTVMVKKARNRKTVNETSRATETDQRIILDASYETSGDWNSEQIERRTSNPPQADPILMTLRFILLKMTEYNIRCWTFIFLVNPYIKLHCQSCFFD